MFVLKVDVILLLRVRQLIGIPRNIFFQDTVVLELLAPRDTSPIQHDGFPQHAIGDLANQFARHVEVGERSEMVTPGEESSDDGKQVGREIHLSLPR